MEGVEAWNKWRQENPDAEIDLSFAKLSDADLSGANLSGANLSDSDLIGANLTKATLSRANLIESNLSDANLSGANLSIANLRRADLSDANLFGVNLNRADLQKAELFRTNLIGVNLSEGNLREVSLSTANLFKAILTGANLREANLIEANLSEAELSCTDLSYADLSGSNLSRTDLSSADLIGSDLSGADFNDADLTESNLSGANLNDADLTGSNLSGANLNDTDLSYAKFLGAILHGADLTGAIIEDWYITKSTQLGSVKCDYIFRKSDFETGKPTARLPADPNSVFVPGEFAQRFQILESALETIDLTFTEGIDWKAFFTSFQKLRQQHPDEEISIQGIERKGEAFIVRLEVPNESDKGAIETRAKQLYEMQLKALEAQYEQQLRLQGAHLEDIRAILESERQERTRLNKVVEKMADEQKAPKYDMRGAQIGSFAETVESDQISTQHNYATPEKQSLADAALEIQRLLKQLEETNPTATEAEQKAFVTAAIPATLRQRAVGALQSGGRAAVEELLDNPYVNIALAVIEGWRTVE